MAGSKARRNADYKLAAALASGMTVEAAAAAAGITRQTAWKRSKTTEFQGILQEIRRETIRTISDRLTHISRAAVARLGKLLSDDEPSMIQLGAVRTALDMVIKFREQNDLEERMDEIEKKCRDLPTP